MCMKKVMKDYCSINDRCGTLNRKEYLRDAGFSFSLQNPRRERDQRKSYLLGYDVIYEMVYNKITDKEKEFHYKVVDSNGNIIDSGMIISSFPRQFLDELSNKISRKISLQAYPIKLFDRIREKDNSFCSDSNRRCLERRRQFILAPNCLQMSSFEIMTFNTSADDFLISFKEILQKYKNSYLYYEFKERKKVSLIIEKNRISMSDEKIKEKLEFKEKMKLIREEFQKEFAKNSTNFDINGIFATLKGSHMGSPLPYNEFINAIDEESKLMKKAGISEDTINNRKEKLIAFFFNK